MGYKPFNDNLQKPNFNRLESDKNGECFAIHTPDIIRIFSRVYDVDAFNPDDHSFIELIKNKLYYNCNKESDIERKSSTSKSLVKLVNDNSGLHLGTVKNFRNVVIYSLDQQIAENKEGYKTKIVHDRVITDLDFSDSWQTLATSSVDRYARIWDLRQNSRKS